MATIKNIIQTIFTSQGAGDVNSDLDRVNKNVTRLGQSSSSAGRAFAAQSQGLGGLVAAYAGAAATVFALQQGFSALAKSARAMQTLEGLNSLAARTAQDGSALLASVREITKGQITLTESAQQINLALSAGFNTKQIEGLSEVSLKASRALGRDLNDAYTRVVRGSAKMETELLDELGIYTKIAPATRAYAAAIGKNVTALTEFERRQAFVNAVIDEGQKKFSSINTTIPTSAEQIEAFGVKMVDLATEVGKLLADTLAPLAAFLTNNVAGAFGAVGVAAGLVAQKAITTITGGMAHATEVIIAKGVALEGIIRKYTGTALAAEKATTAIKSLTAANIALQGTQKTQLTSLIESANARKLSTPELVKSRDLIKQNITALEAERNAMRSTAGAEISTYRDTLKKIRDAKSKIDAAKAMPVGGGFGTREFIDRTTAINRANNELKRAQQEQAKLKPAVDSTTASIRANTQALVQNKAALTQLTPATKGFIAGLSGFAVSSARQLSLFASGYTTLFSGILGAASKLFFVGTIFTLIGSSIAGALGKGDEFEGFLKRIGALFTGVFGDEKLKQAKNVITGLTAYSLSELEKTNSELASIDSFKFKTKVFGVEIEVEKSKQDLANEVNSLLAGTFAKTEKSLTKSASSISTLIGSIIGNLAPLALSLIPGFGIAGTIAANTFGRAFTTGLGAFAGSIFDYLFASDIEVPEDILNKVKEQFASSLEGLDTNIKDKLAGALAQLEVKYGEVAKFDPQARLALRTQQELVLASKDYLGNVESISQAMQATGQSADQIVKTLKFDKASMNFIDIEEAILGIQTKLEDTTFEGKLKFNFIDVDQSGIQSLIEKPLTGAVMPAALEGLKDSPMLDTIKTDLLALKLEAKEGEDVFGKLRSSLTQVFSGEENAKELDNIISRLKQLNDTDLDVFLGSSASITEYTIDIRDSTLEAIGAVNEFSRAGLRLASVQKTLEERVNAGSISLEDFAQSIGASKDAQITTERYYSTTLQSIDKLKEKAKGLSGDQLIAANALISDLEKVAENTFTTLGYQRQITSELEKQRGVLETQGTAADFFKSFELEKPKNPLALELEFKLAGNLTPLDELTSKLAYLQTFIKQQGSDIVEQYDANRKALQGIALDAAEVQKVLATPAEDIIQLTDELNALQGVAAYYNGTVLEISTGTERVAGTIENAATATVDMLEGSLGRTQQLTELATQAQKDVILSAVQELPGFIDKALDEYTKLIKDAKDALRQLASEEVALKIKFDMDTASLDAQIAEIASNAIVRKLQFEADVITAKKDLKQIDPVTAAKQVEEIQQKIITQQQYLLSQQLIADQEALDSKSKLIEAEKQASQEQIKQESQAQRTKILNDIAYVNGLKTLYAGIIAKQQELDNKSVQDIIKAGNAVADSWAKTFESGGASVATAIINALTSKTLVTTGVKGGSASFVPDAMDTSLEDSVTNFNTTALDAMSTVNQLEAERLAAAETAAAREQELLEKNRELLIAKYQEEFSALEDSRTLQSLNTQKALQDASKGSDEAAKKAEEARKKVAEAYKDISNSLKESIRTVAKEIVSFVGGILVNLAQSRVDNLKAQETQLQDALAVSTSKLNDVSSRLEQTLSQETSQREELLSITKDLAESNKEYVKSLGSQDRNVQASSDTYVQNLLKQKRAIIDLASSTRKAVALSATEKKLSTINSSLQEQLNDTTFARMDAEERLVATQGMVQVITDSVTASSEGLAQGLTNLRSAMMAMLEVTGMVSGSDMSAIAQQANMSDAFGALSGAVNNFKEGVTSLKKVNGNYVTASGKTVANVEKFNSTMNTVSNVIGGAVSGFNIGNSIATALGVSGFATQIGGAIGGIITSGAMGAAITTAITSGLGVAVGSLGATLISFAVPIIGPIIGALVGSLFAKKPKAGASTGFDASGEFVTTGAYASGGGSEKGYADIMKSTYTSFFGSLEEFGIELQKQGKNFGFAIDTAKKRMTASFTKNGEKILSQQISGGEDAAKFFIDAFLKTFDKGDLVVRSSVAYAENLQSAIDNFATKAKDERTQKVFNEYLQFATKFATKIAELRGPATSTADAIDLIKESAKANTAQLTQFYTSFLDKTREVFGESSKEYGVAGAAVRKNALAQLGLADSANKSTGDFIALSDAMESVDAGTVMVENAVASINAFADTMRAVGQFSDSEISNAISKSREVTLTSIVTNANESLKAGIDMLENPANEAVSTIVSVTDNAASRVSNLQGTYNALIANSATEAQKSIAASNIALSNQLSKLEITSVLNSLSDAELKAVVAAEEKIDATIREEAATRLAAVSASKFAKAQVKIADIGRRIASELSDLPALPNIVTSVADLMDLFEVDTVTPFVNTLSDLVNSIAKGENITSNFDASLTALTSEFNSGAITADQYTEGLDLVASSTLDVINTLEEMVSQYENLTEQIYSAYQAQVDAVSTAAEEVGSQLTDMLDSFGSASTELLRLYDTTLASVAKSGNELFDLEDSAKSAFETAAKAVKEFEDANKLSGKSSSAVLADITSIQSQLNDLSSRPFDLSSLLQFSKLSSQQRSLQSEYNKLTKVEQEYNDLLATRTTAQQDLAFATATIDSLNDTLIDTRRTESEIVQKVQDAAISYTKSQENLTDITKLLTEANFNLNQIRSNEVDSVYKTITLLDQLRSSFVGLSDITQDILNSESGLQEQLVSAARENYKIRLDLATEAERASMAPMEVFLEGIRGYYTQLESAATDIQGMLENPINSLSESLKKGVLDITAFNLQISDQFSGFSADISEYIDLTTVSNNIKEFANSLDITQNRFAILASSSGPLNGLNAYLQETYNTIGLLTESGNYLDISFERVKTAFGSIFTALGTDTAGLVAAVANVSIVGKDAVANLSNVTSYLKDFATQIGAVKINLTNIDALGIPVILDSLKLDVTPLNKISELVQVINLVDTDIGSIDLTNLNSFAGSVVNIVTGINSTLSGLNLNLSSNISTDITNFIYGLGDVLDITISLNLKEQVQTTVRTYVYSVGDSITNLSVSGNLAESARATIETYVSSAGDATLNTSVSSALKDSAELIISNYVKSIGNTSLNISIASTLKDSAILSIKNYVESIGTSTSTMTISSTLSDKAAQTITNYVNSIGDSKTTISITGTTLRDNAILAVKNYVSAIGTNTSTFSITGATLSGNAIAAIDSYVKGVGTNTSTFTISGTTLSGNAVAAIKTYVEAVGTNKSTFSITNTTLSGNAVAAISTYVKAVGTNTSTFSITGTTITDNAIAAINTYVKAVGTNTSTFTVTGTTLSGNAVAAIKTYVEAVGANTSTFTITGTTLSGNAVAAIKTYVEAIGTNTSKFTVTGTTLSGNAVAAIDTYVKAVGTNTSTFDITGATLSGNAIAAIKTYVEAVGTNTSKFTVTGTTLSGNAVAAIDTYVKAIGTNTSTFSITGATLSGNAVAAIKTYVEAVGTNTSTFTVSNATLSGNAIAAIKTYVEAVGTNKSTFSITGTTLSGNAVAAIDTYVKAVGTNTSTFSITGTTITDNAVAAISTYVKAVGTNTSTFSIAGTTLSGNAVAAIKTYVEAVGTNTSTFTITGTTLSGNAVAAIKTYVESVGTNSSAISLTYATTSGLGLKVKTWADSLLAGTDVILTYSTTATGTLANNIATFVGKITKGDSITATYDTTAANTLANKVSAYIKSVVDGTGIAASFDTTVATSTAGKLALFIKSVVDGTNISATYNTGTANTLANKIFGFTDNVFKGTGIDLTYNKATTGTLAYSIDQYITSFKNAITTAMSGIQDAFKNVTPVVESLRLALTGAAVDGKDITTTQGLIEAIRDVNSGTGVSALTSSFKTLRDALTPLLDTVSGTKTLDGPLTAFKNKLDSIKTSIQTQWNNLQISATGTSMTNPGFVRIVTTGTAKDPNTDALKTIADNSAKYPKITGASYTVSNFAEGGYVEGPGSNTSDSIKANLSNGEFVVKASAVRNLGVGTLDALNSGKTLGDIMGMYGRNGDSIVAHINPAEIEMLLKAGGSGTINPNTGLMEFFSKDGGAVAKLFAQQEKDLLAKTYLGYFPTSNFNSRYEMRDNSFGRPERIRYTAFGGAANQPWGPNLSLEETYYGENGSWGNPGHTNLFDLYNREQLKSAQVGAVSLANEIMHGRKDNSTVKDSTFQYAQDWEGPRWGSDGVNVSGIPSGNVQTGWGPYRRFRWGGLFNTGVRGYDAVDGGWIAKSGQALTQFMQDGLGASIPRPQTQVDASQISAAVDAANVSYGNSGNLYMLGNTNESRPSAAMLTSGGLVTDEFSSNSARDSVNALLEPGEFVLRKQAVDRMGLDNAIRLNSTGDTGGDIEVEVNINNNGTSQTTIGTPEVRRENGKIVVDIILEDLRNNGPIKRQIRSIR